MNVVFFGFPTAGKGTQSKLLSQFYNIEHISTGDIFREAMAKKMPLGLEVDAIMKSGNLVPDEITDRVVGEKLSGMKDWILDGYPRSLNQSKLFDTFTRKNVIFPKYIYLNLLEIDVWTRSLDRREKEGRPEDATSEVIKKRIDVFKITTLPAIKYFSKKDTFYSIDASLKIEEIHNKIKHILSL